MTTSKTAVAEKKEKTPELRPQEDVLAVGGELLAEPEDEQALPAPPKKKKFAEGLCFDKLVWIFVIGCIIGFIVETLWCYVRWGKIESRKGLIYGPFTPIYGFGGVLLTLWLTAKIADSAKQREVRQAMQLVALELRDNLQVIQDYKWMYNDEKRVAYRLKEHDFSLDGLPADTVAYYTRRITGSMGKPYRFLTDALEMFKTTGIASDIADKQIVIDLLRCYNELGAFDNSMNIYYDQRMKAILPEQMGETLWSADTNIDKAFGKMLASKKVRNWLGMIPRAFDSRYFETNEEKLETMIAELEKRYQ